MTGCPESATGTAPAPAAHPAVFYGEQFPAAGVASAASTARAPGGMAGLPEHNSSAGRARHPEQDHPRYTQLELTAMPSAVPCARLHARNVVAEWGMTAIARTAELLVSELVTNAITASPGSVVTIRLTASNDAVLIEVHDPSPRMPELQDASDDTEHGRGLMLVTSLSAQWGARLIPGCGKIAWCVLGLS
jgi:anti-sigma regulatory factor (Ser/Thr protein kinase)